MPFRTDLDRHLVTAVVRCGLVLAGVIARGPGPTRRRTRLGDRDVDGRFRCSGGHRDAEWIVISEQVVKGIGIDDVRSEFMPRERIEMVAEDLFRPPGSCESRNALVGTSIENLFASMGIVILLVVVGVHGLANRAKAIIVHEGSTILHVLDAPRLFGVADEAVPIDRKESP